MNSEWSTWIECSLHSRILLQISAVIFTKDLHANEEIVFKGNFPRLHEPANGNEFKLEVCTFFCMTKCIMFYEMFNVCCCCVKKLI